MFSILRPQLISVMDQLIASFTRQLNEAIRIGEAAQLTPAAVPIHQVVITGLGGSGIGGTIVSEITSEEAKVPVIVNKDYFLPGFVSAHTLVVVSSYSGNTEETLQAMDIALEKKAKIICVSSGGKVVEKAKALKLDHIIIPGGMPPRACLAYSMTQLFYILSFHSIITTAFKEQFQAAVRLLDTEEKEIREKAKEITNKLSGKIPVIYSVAGCEGVAIRFRQQVNENGKMLCWHHVIPEMNHNELVGWREKNEALAVIFFRNKNDFGRNQTRIEINKKIISQYTSNITDIYSKGASPLENALYLIHLGDWISYYLAAGRGMDPVEVKVIDFLKAELSKV